MEGLLKQGQSTHPLTFVMVDSSDHTSGKTGLSPTVRLSKNGGTGAVPAGAVSEVDATNHPGLYKVAGNATDSNTLGPLALHASAAGADPTDLEWLVVGFDPDTAWLTSAPTAGAISDQVWDEALADHAGAGSSGAALAAAGALGDPWTTALPGGYGAGTAGSILGNLTVAGIWSYATRTLTSFGDLVQQLLDALFGGVDEGALAIVEGRSAGRVSQLTWKDIVDFITSVHTKEQARPNPGLYRILARQAIGIISARSRIYTRAWSNATGGRLVLSGNTCAIPIECLEITRVEWDGVDNPLDRNTEEILDEREPGWRDATGEPSAFALTGADLWLNATPSPPVVGKLVVRGISHLPDFSQREDTGEGLEPNPLSWLPAHLQLSPAYYVLAELPADPEIKLEAARVIKYSALWEKALAELEGSANRRRLAEFEY